MKHELFWWILGSVLVTFTNTVCWKVVYHNINKATWECTKDARVGDSIPAEYECVQYSRIVKDGGRP